MEKGATCKKCGLTSMLTERFWHGLCPACQPGPFLRVSTAGGITAILLASGGLALVTYLALEGKDLGFVERAVDFVGPFSLAFVVAWFLGPVRILLHEATHCVTARLLGWPVDEVRVLYGDRLFQFRIGGTRWTVGRRLVPSEGHCAAAPTAGNVGRGACIAYCLMPSVVELAVVAALVPFFDMDTFGGRLAIVLSGLMVLDVLGSLWPKKGKPGGGGALSDGMHLRQLLVAPDTALADWRRASIVHPVLRVLADGRPDEALKELDAVLPRLPDDRRTRGLRAVILQLCGRTEEVLQHVDDFAFVAGEAGGFTGDEAAAYLRGSLLAKLDRLDEVVALSEQAREAAADEEARARWSACLALALLLRRQDEESVSRAASEAAYAFARLPWVDYVVTAQGMALVERAEYDEGLRLLDRRSEIDLSGMRDAWRVVAHAARGRQSDVIQSMERLRAIKPWPACLRRAEAALGRDADAEP